jgi:hydrogenase expression/formation protein HypC
MCVAVPAQILWIGEGDDTSVAGRVEAAGKEMTVDLVMVPGAAVGDYVITHAGYAIRVVPSAEALEARRLLA